MAARVPMAGSLECVFGWRPYLSTAYLEIRLLEARTVLGGVGGRQRDGDAAVGPVEAGVAEGGADAVAGLEHGGVAEPDHGDRGEPAADVDLDAHWVGDEADQRGGRQPGEHRSENPLEVVDRRRPAARPQANVSCTRRTAQDHSPTSARHGTRPHM